MLPVSNPHPVITNPVTIRASAALAAAGAWDAAPLELSSAGFRWATLFFAYTRGAAGGAFDFQSQVSPYSADAAGVEDWFPQSVYSVGALGAGADTQSRIQREYITYASQGAAAETFGFGPLDIQAIERIRVRARESGVTGTPGTLHVVAVMWE